MPVFVGVVDSAGHLHLEARGLLDRYLRTLANKRVTLVVKPEARPKSQNQLGYLFGVLYPVIAEEIGYRAYEVEEIHDACMRKLRGLKPEPNPLQLRETLRDKEHEYVSDYIGDLRHWALMDYGIVTPDAHRAEVAT